MEGISLHKFLEGIKTAAMEAVEAASPVIVAYGTVISAKPLSVQLDQKILLASEFLVTMGHAFEKGDRLVLLRIQGGQEYLVLGKKVEG